MALNTLFRCLAFAWIVVGSSQISSAQIIGDEESAAFLAAQCSASAGLPAENYSEYGKKLALTLSLLDASQQERVFGYLPTPGATSAMANDSGDRMASEGESASTDSPQSGFVDNLFGGVTGLIQELQQSGKTSAPVIAGTPPATGGDGGESIPPVVGGVAVPNAGGDGTGAGLPGAETFPEPPTEVANDDGDKGHGNSEGLDPDNPGKEGNKENKKGDNSVDDDGDNGHGNSGGFDLSNPGKGGGPGGKADKTPTGQSKT